MELAQRALTVVETWAESLHPGMPPLFLLLTLGPNREIVLQPSSYPLMIMCNLGRHRTGTVVGCLRKLQRWNLASIFEEYRRHAGAKVRVMNEQVGRERVDIIRRTPSPLRLLPAGRAS